MQKRTTILSASQQMLGTSYALSICTLYLKNQVRKIMFDELDF
jgi:hypothetical protein